MIEHVNAPNVEGGEWFAASLEAEMRVPFHNYNSNLFLPRHH